MRRETVIRGILPLLCLVFILLCAPGARAAEADTEGAYEAIVASFEQVLAGSVTVDLSAYNITVEQLNELVSRSSREGLQPWYIGPFSYQYNTETRIVSNVTFRLREPEVYDYDLYEQTVAEVLAETVKPGMNQWQIALSIHDYLVANCAYDETYTYYTGYDALVRGTAVCNGYALAYMDLLNRAGIECVKVSSEAMDHAWNLVKIGENWFHVDVTWDDPTSDRQGRVYHKYFLISDAAISDAEHEHYGWETDIVCSFTEWDTDRLWSGIESQICFESKDLCYLRDQTGKTAYTIYSRDSQSGNWTKITSCDAGYIDIGGSKDADYFYRNNGLSYYEGKLYYSDMVKVYSINPDGSGKKTVYTHNYQDNKTYIAGSFVSEGVLYMTLADHDGNLSAMQITLGTPRHTHSYTATTVPPTCGKMGYDLCVCDCGICYNAAYTPALEHTYGEGVVIREATESSHGITRYTCTHCGESYEQYTIYTPVPTEPSENETEKEVTQEEYTVRRILVIAAILVLLHLIKRKKR